MPGINQENARLEIESLERQLRDKKRMLERGPERIERRESEITKEDFQEQEALNVQIQKTAPSYVREINKAKEVEIEANKIKSLDTERQMKVLVALAFEKGISHCVEVARRINDAYLLDKLHDRLVGDLHDELIAKGKLKDV